MRLGAAFWEGSPTDEPQVTIDRLNEIGIKGAWLNYTKEEGWPQEEVDFCRQAFAEAGIFVGAIACMHYQLLSHPDAAVRQRGVESVKRCIRDSHALGAHCISIHWRPGGAEDWWSEECWNTLVRASEPVFVEAERLGVDIGFHSHPLCPWDSPEQHRRLADEIASPRAKVLVDVVNMMTARTCQTTTDFLNHTFDLIGDIIVAAHAKDVRLDPSHWVVKIDEVPPGLGTMDFETFMRRLSELDEDLVLTIEHLRDVGVAGTHASPIFVYHQNTHWEFIRAKKFIQDVAGRIGVVAE